jgi:hypothetical protein
MEIEEGRVLIHEKLDRPNPLLRLQEEFEMGLTRLKDLQRLEKEQKKLLRGLFKKMEGRAFQTFMKDEVVNLVEEEPRPETPVSDYRSPTPPGLAPLRIPIPVPFIAPPVPRRRPTPYPLFLQGNSREGGEGELEYPTGCLECRYDANRCAGCETRIWGVRD